MGHYIVDFYCREQSLVVELDGSQHLNSADDVTRDAWLNSQGLKVLRFWNHDVLTNIDSVLEQIRLSCSPLLGEGPAKRGERA
jgi:very-short-patch-repair endonuclease